ncbi:MAG TPA: hypothetical protein VG433_09025 [Pirellulales bacterium]|jgi:hypothetical protein|nr:hypothetical protein [Pirellulales bacterium]
MHAKRIALFASLIYLSAGYVQAEPAKTAAVQGQASQPVAAAATPAKAANSAADDIASRPEPWRYQWYENHWWYYTPQNTWLYYNSSGWHPWAASATTYWAPSYHSHSTQKHVDPGHSLDTTGNYPRYWLWQRLGN